MVDGWLFKITTRGLEDGTRPITNWWAAWHRDESTARAAVLERTGPCDPQPEVERTLSEDDLKKMGLTRSGDVRNVRTDA